MSKKTNNNVKEFAKFVRDKALEIHEDTQGMVTYFLKHDGSRKFQQVPDYLREAPGKMMLHAILKGFADSPVIDSIGISFTGRMKKVENMSKIKSFESAEGIEFQNIVYILVQSRDEKPIAYLFHRDLSSGKVEFISMNDKIKDCLEVKGLFSGLFD